MWRPQVPAVAALTLLAALTRSTMASMCSTEYTLKKTTVQSNGAEAGVSTQLAGRSIIECATLCTAWRPCRWFDFRESLRKCCLADRPVQCWRSETETDDSFGELTDACCSTETCRKEVVSGDTRYCVIMQRVSDSVLFNRTWAEYENGFGDAQNWWIGLKSIHSLTRSGKQKLRVEMTSWSNTSFFCEHPNFAVQSSQTKYTMAVLPFLSDRCSVNLDAMLTHSGMQFSTIDADNDEASTISCSQFRGGGGWWFRACMMPNPTGIYSSVSIPNRQNMLWRFPPAEDVPLRQVRLMVSTEP